MSRSTTKGHVRRRGKTWTYVLYRGRDENGKRRYTWRGGFRTSREAQAALTEALQALGNRTFVERSDVTVAEWLRQWLQAERKNWRPSTFAGRVVAVEKHLVPKLGHHRLQALTSQQVTAAYNELLEDGHHQRGGGLSARSVRIAHGVLQGS